MHWNICMQECQRFIHERLHQHQAHRAQHGQMISFVLLLYGTAVRLTNT